MEYLNINFLANTPNQPTKFRTKNWVKKVMTHAVVITPIVKLSLKLQC